MTFCTVPEQKRQKINFKCNNSISQNTMRSLHAQYMTVEYMYFISTRICVKFCIYSCTIIKSTTEAYQNKTKPKIRKCIRQPSDGCAYELQSLNKM